MAIWLHSFFILQIRRTVDKRTNTTVEGEGSVGSLPSNGAPVPDEPANSHRPSGNVTSRPFALFAPPLESWDFA